MEMKVSALCIIFLLTILFSESVASFPSSSFNTDSICKHTPHADFCKYLFSSNKLFNTLDYGRVSIHHSLLNARTFLDSINQHFLAHPLNSTSKQALEDCRFLADQNVDFLSQISDRINSSTESLDSVEADDLHALLSAALTNVETCLEALESTPSASRIKDRFLQSNGTKSFSVSLAVSKHWLIVDTYTPLSVFMSSNDKQTIYEYATGKRDVKTLTNGKITVKQVVMVSHNGDGQFKTINDAITAMPNVTGDSNEYYVIYIPTGVYEEYISIPKYKQNLVLVGGLSTNPTIISGNRSVGGGSTTFSSATLAVFGKKFIAVDITFRNTAGPSKYQAVAVLNGADQSIFNRCTFEGYRNTLYVHSFRQFYVNCHILGTVDFIFGNAAAVIQESYIHARLPLPTQDDVITAQGRTDPSQNTGISIISSFIRANDDLISNMGFTKYIWEDHGRRLEKRDGDFGLSTVYFGEYDNYGLGRDTGDRVDWPGFHNMTKTEALNFTVARFIRGNKWLPATGVHYFGGLRD
ncbi:hypothetical protein ERO13_A08G101048v2 [Gossypium hirsutum]|nr:hypothetical protein ERO13_A08G101048v2 [Gossypium hirsutum]